MKIIYPDKDKIIPSKRRFFFRAGIKNEDKLPDELKKRLKETEKKGLDYSAPVILYTEIDISSNNVRRILPTLLMQSERIQLFASSLGEKIDTKINELVEDNRILDATLLDAWSSESIETLNIWFDKQLRDKNVISTRRFSPGYGDMNITRNYDLLHKWLSNDIIRANKKTGILVPKKSTICMIGQKDYKA